MIKKYKYNKLYDVIEEETKYSQSVYNRRIPTFYYKVKKKIKKN